MEEANSYGACGAFSLASRLKVEKALQVLKLDLGDVSRGLQSPSLVGKLRVD